MSKSIKITKCVQSKINSIDFNNVSFGSVFTDYMFVCDYKNNAWQNPEIIPYAPISFHPSLKALHYGQAVFEGMKAYKDTNNDVWLFRPEENVKRINKSSERLCIPQFPEEIFLEGLKNLVNLERDWIKKGEGNSLYLRPFIFASEETIQANESTQYKFMIICSPARFYYSGDVNVKIADKFSRATSGGTGYAKAAGNYAGQFYPTKLAKEEGFDQIIWTDSNTHKYLEEAGTMNVMFRIGDKIITAPTSDRILDGITRKSIIKLAESKGIEVEQRYLSVKELIEASENGSLNEIFGCGTAAVITQVKSFNYKGKTWQINRPNETYADTLKKQITDIQYNNVDDPFNWCMKV